MAKREKLPVLPTTATIELPAMGRSVALRALTKAELIACFPTPFSINALAVNIICAGVTSEKLDPATVWQVYARYGDAPLIRIGGLIVRLSGYRDIAQLKAPRIPLMPLHP